MSSAIVVSLLGPTASGKTELVMQLSDLFPLHLISVDSAQIYRHMDIGTAKPEPALLAKYPHALIDILEVEESYSAAQFCRDAMAEISKAHANGKIAVLVGGTMMYYHALFAGLAELPTSDSRVRQALLARSEAQGLQPLYEELCRFDTAIAKQVKPNDKQRIIRFLEIITTTGKTPSTFFAEQEKPEHAFISLPFGLLPERHLLHQRIAQRFDHMLAQGFVAEVEALMRRPKLTADHPSMRAVGYRQIWQYLQGDTTLEQARELGIIATRQLAKRQITWMRNRLQESLAPQILDPTAATSAEKIISIIKQHLDT